VAFSAVVARATMAKSAATTAESVSQNNRRIRSYNTYYYILKTIGFLSTILCSLDLLFYFLAQNELQIELSTQGLLRCDEAFAVDFVLDVLTDIV
jgi:hypothetical protein